MNINSISFQKLPFTQLFKDYTSNRVKTDPFFETNAFSDSDIRERLGDYSFKGNRNDSVEFLKNYNARFTDDANVFESIEKLNDEHSIAIVTGQQLTMFGGPLFTVFKILTTIHTAQTWEKKYNRPCIPVFWLADEDHDFDEVASIGIPNADDIEHITLGGAAEYYSRVADMELDDHYPDFRKLAEQSLVDTDFSYDLWKLLDSCYKPGSTFGLSFGKLILQLFSRHGLILAGSNSVKAKNIIKEPLKRSVADSQQLYQSLNEISVNLLEAGYHNQVQLHESNIFWIDPTGIRRKINFIEDNWIVDEPAKKWSTSELIDEIDAQPHLFSPNVFLRPVVQNFLLPGVAYVAGPGEVAYYAQMKHFYNTFDLKMPVIIPRFSATIIESGIDRILPKLPFSIEEYAKRIEDLESEYINRSDNPDLEPVFANWKEEFDAISSEKIDQIEAIDATLRGASEKVKAQFFTELDKLKGKVYRSLKEQEGVQLQRIRKVKALLFPNSNLQEREVAIIYFMNKYGLTLWDTLLEVMQNAKPDEHNIIHL